MKVSASDSPEVIGQTMLIVLGSSHSPIPHPTRHGGLVDALLKLAKVRSWLNFTRGTKAVGIDRDEQGFKFTPDKNEGGRGYFTPLSDKVFRLPADAPAKDLGLALEKAFSLCEDVASPKL
jgi:hypothetical protein